VTGFRHLGPGSDLPGWIEELESDCFGKPWGALDGGDHLWAVDLAGFARWQVVAAAEEAELVRIAVRPSFRRAGQGAALLRHCQAELARMGIATLFLEVRISNAPARALYEKEGWEEIDVRAGYYRDGEDAAIYRRRLSFADLPGTA
jgi:ribosomal-protein-alanine N-acetyltransferase